MESDATPEQPSDSNNFEANPNNPASSNQQSTDSNNAEAYEINADEDSENQPVTAELVEEPVRQISMRSSVAIAQPALDMSGESMAAAAIGGAVGSVALGIWTIITAFITPFAVINALLSIALGMYGVTSSKKRLALIGMALAVVGFVISWSHFISGTAPR